MHYLVLLLKFRSILVIEKRQCRQPLGITMLRTLSKSARIFALRMVEI